MGWQEYVPAESVSYVESLLSPYRVDVRVSRERATKSGDFRPGKQKHRISVNSNLNPYHFLWVLVHEIAHLHVHEYEKRRVPPHGQEWKDTFRILMWPLLDEAWMPEEIKKKGQQHLINPKATTHSDPALLSALHSFNSDMEKPLTVADLEDGETFELKGKIFKRGPKQRTRYKCLEVSTGRWFLVHGIAPASMDFRSFAAIQKSR